MPPIASENLPTTNNNTGGLLGSLGSVKIEHSLSEVTLDRLLALLVIVAFVWGGVGLLGVMFRKMIEKQ